MPYVPSRCSGQVARMSFRTLLCSLLTSRKPRVSVIALREREMTGLTRVLHELLLNNLGQKFGRVRYGCRAIKSRITCKKILDTDSSVNGQWRSAEGKRLYLGHQRLMIKVVTMTPYPFEMVGREDQSVSHNCVDAERLIKLVSLSVSAHLDKPWKKSFCAP